MKIQIYQFMEKEINIYTEKKMKAKIKSKNQMFQNIEI